MNKIKSLIVILAAASVPILYSCDRPETPKTITIDVDPNYFRQEENYAGNNTSTDAPYFIYNLNGKQVWLTPDATKNAELNISPRRTYPNLDSLEILTKSTESIGEFPIHIITRVILSQKDSLQTK